MKEEVRKLKTPLFVYLKNDNNNKDDNKIAHSPFVEVKLGGRNVYIRKTTAIWLFQDTERVSSDRIFRVRATQPGQSID